MDENKGSQAQQPEAPSVAELNKATQAVCTALDKLPPASQRSVLRAAHTLLGFDVVQPAARTQQRTPDNNNNRGNSQQRGGR